MKITRPSGSTEIEVKNGMRIYLNSLDIVSHVEIDAKKHAICPGYIFVGNALPKHAWTFFQPTGSTGTKKYMKTKYYPRSALVIVADIEHKGNYIDVPKNTKIFFCKMGESGVLSSIGAGYTGKIATVIINPPDAETIRKYECAKEILE